MRPLISPDGKWLVYATRFDTKTGLRVRELETGEERWLIYPVTRDDQESRATRDTMPGYAFTPDSAVCLEYGSPNTPLLRFLNDGDDTPGPTRYLVIRNADASFVYFSVQDGVFPPVPAQDREGNPHDFSQSARLEGAHEVDLVGQGAYDDILGSAHLGILNSPVTWQRAFDFLADGNRRH